MRIVTLIEFASEKTIARLLIKERIKYRRRNFNETDNHALNRDCDLYDLKINKQLSRLTPPRHHWKWTKKREKRNGVSDSRKNAKMAMMHTYKHDVVKEKKESAHFAYLDEMRAFRKRIIDRLSDDNLSFHQPELMIQYKDKKLRDDGTFIVTGRPLSVYKNLEDKIILALTNSYLTYFFDSYLHENILSYRKVKYDKVEKRAETIDFSEGAKRIMAFREKHNADTIYVSDCDIKKFYDTFHHQMVSECFERLLKRTPLNDEGKTQVMRVLNAYLKSYNFYDNVLVPTSTTKKNPLFAKIRKKVGDVENKNAYVIGKVDKIPDKDYKQRGIPQGGALSLMIANVVLNDVDQEIIKDPDDNRLFLRYCDDMILMHTDRDECKRLMDMYVKSLSDHDLVYHDFESVCDSKTTSKKYNNAFATTKDFWKIKSHKPFLWGKGDGDSNLYVGFLGYEIRRDGRIRLRKSNVEKIKEKFNRQRHIIMRHKEDSPNDYEEFRDKRLQSVLNGLLFYEAFDKDVFEHGSQYKYIMKLQRQTRRSVK